MFEVPNLDDFSIEPKDFAEAARVLRLLAEYAERKGRAMINRRYGEIPRAVKFEQANDVLYRSLPDWAKW